MNQEAIVSAAFGVKENNFTPNKHLHVQSFIPLTSLLSCHLAGNTGDVTVKARPASLTLAAVCGSPLPAVSSVLTGRRVAPTHQVLQC